MIRGCSGSVLRKMGFVFTESSEEDFRFGFSCACKKKRLGVRV